MAFTDLIYTFFNKSFNDLMLLDSQVFFDKSTGLSSFITYSCGNQCKEALHITPTPLLPTLFSLFSVVELDAYHSESSDSKVGIICLLIYQAVILFWFVSGYLLFLLDRSV